MTPTLIYNKYQGYYTVMMDEGDKVAINADNDRVTVLHAIGDGMVSYRDSMKFKEVV